MTVTLPTMQTLTGSGTAITTLLTYPQPQCPKNLITSARITKLVLGSPGEQLLHLLHTSYATVSETGTDNETAKYLGKTQTGSPPKGTPNAGGGSL